MDQISLGTRRDRDGKGTTAQEAQGNGNSSQPKITMTWVSGTDSGQTLSQKCQAMTVV